ncbi:MAG: type II/IV secretion system protein [Candidatus Taylorbacteria bacterium]|nr:type II/IV secretion system protein [Candidatus Taylorbacteria bacterium]
MYIEPIQLKKYILESGLVASKDILAAEKEATEKKKDIGDVLVSSGKISEDDFRRMQAHILGIPFVDLKHQKLEFEVLSLIPEPIARNHNIVAFKRSTGKEGSLEVAMLDTDDLGAIDFIKKKTGLKILPRLTNTESMKSALIQYQKSLKADFGDIIQQEATNLKVSAGDAPGGEEVSGDDLKKLAEDLPVIRIVDTLLKHAVLQDASDIHIEQMEFEVVVRYRIDGMLHDAMILPKVAGPSIIARIKVLSNLKLDEKRLPQDGRFRIELNGEKISFRVSILPTYFGEKVVMRLLRETVSGFTLEKLGFHGRDLEILHEATNMSEGLILTTGPTGSGKTTTLYTLLDIVNQPDVNISTVEDPVEYQMKRVNQTQIKSEIGLTFAAGLRSLLRQDPDVIMVGEIRDNETASLAINAALTGHLVLSTLHTNSAAGAVPRLTDMKCEPFLLVSTLKIIIAQRLVRKLSDSKERYFLTKEELASISKKVDMDNVLKILKAENIVGPKDDWTTIPFFKPKPTGESEDGYHGRIGIHEVLRVTPTIKEIVIKGGTSDEIEAQARKEGMMTMIEDGIFKAVQGYTTIEEILRVVSE